MSVKIIVEVKAFVIEYTLIVYMSFLFYKIIIYYCIFKNMYVPHMHSTFM